METLIQQSIQYRGYTIEKSFRGYDFYPTEQGRDDDYDLDGEDYKYCGNVRHASTIEEAKDAIDEKIIEAKPYHIVKLNGRDYPFPWLEDARKFASLWNADLLPNGQPILNP